VTRGADKPNVLWMTTTTHNTSVGALAPQERTSEAEIIDLDRDECLRLLSDNTFGRIVVVLSNGAPVIRPVNYVFDQSSKSVVFRSGLGSKLHAVLKSHNATFEIDGVDPEGRVGWSVIISGVTEEVTRQADIDRLDGLGVDTFAPGSKHHWLRVRAWTVSGRKIVAGTDDVPGYRA